MFATIKNKVRQFNSITMKKVFFQLFLDKAFTDLIVRLNTEGESTSQLIGGIDSKNEKLDDIGGEYSPYTVMIKKDKGQIIDRVVLRDTGYFYSSFKTFFKNEEDGVILITADTIKEGGDDLITRWGRDIIGLNETNLGVLRDYARTKIVLIVNKRLAA